MAAKYEHLTKERELELGGIIQKRSKAIEKLKSTRISERTRAQHKKDISAGDLAIDELVKANLGLVYDRARVFKSKFPSAPDMEDLVSMGTIGLMTALQKYDPARGNKFSTVAYYWIAQAIGREVNKTSRLVRLPENRIADYTRMNGVASRYEEFSLGYTELDKRIMEELDLNKTELMNIRNAASFHASLNRKIGGGGGEGTKELMDIVGEEKVIVATEHSVTTNECFSILSDELQSLEPLKREVIASHFSLAVDGIYPTAQEIREVRSLSSSKFRRILSEGLSELKASLAAKDLNLLDFIEV